MCQGYFRNADSGQRTADTLTPNQSQSNLLTKNKKIAFVHEYFPCGGAEIVTSMLAVELAKKNYETYVFAREFDHHLLTENDNQYIKLIQVTWDDLFHPIYYNNTIIQTSNKENIDILIFVGATVIDIQGISKGLKCKTIFAYHDTPFWEIENQKQILLRENNTIFLKNQTRQICSMKLKNVCKMNIILSSKDY